jgi:hypothetical protein
LGHFDFGQVLEEMRSLTQGGGFWESTHWIPAFAGMTLFLG